MDLWLRHRKASQIEKDIIVTVSTMEEWREAIDDPRLVSSVLWPVPPLFPVQGNHFKRNHPHERDYVNNTNRNDSFREACKLLASRILKDWSAARCLVYAPLRGAFPIWKCIRQFLDGKSFTVYYPVTSSFIFYPESFRILNSKNKIASGRYNNIFELERIRPFLEMFDILIYIDEIISGSMMWGYLKDMMRLRINEQIPIVAVGLADAHGGRSEINRRKIGKLIEYGMLRDLYWEGCRCLITEDQKFLLGMHYTDYHLGPHVVPVLDANLSYYQEKLDFNHDILSERFHVQDNTTFR
jgi:hypothetical protein